MISLEEHAEFWLKRACKKCDYRLTFDRQEVRSGRSNKQSIRAKLCHSSRWLTSVPLGPAGIAFCAP